MRGSDEQARIELWRFERLVELGVADDEAIRLAQAGADWHAFELLIRGRVTREREHKGGCPPELAIRILAPLENPSESPAKSKDSDAVHVSQR